MNLDNIDDIFIKEFRNLQLKTLFNKQDFNTFQLIFIGI